MKGRNNNNKVPTFDDIDNIDDDLQHIGEVYPNKHKDDVKNLDQIASIKHQSIIDDKTDRRYRCSKYDEKCLVDPTISHVKRGMILLPVNMTPTHVDKKETMNEDSSSAPTYSINQSRISLFTSFPPPPTIVQPRRLEGYNEIDLKHAKQRLKQDSGYYFAAGVTTATKLDEGYSDSILSMNYRIPTLISWPSLLMRYSNNTRQQYLVSDMHYNLHIGSTTKTSIGTTLSTLDGKTHLRFDMGNPFYSYENGDRVSRRMQKKNASSMITSPSLQSDYTISASHDFDNSLQANWLMKIAPSPPLIFSNSSSSTSPIHMQYMNLTLTNMTGTRNRLLPKLTLTLGYGMPLLGGEAVWVSNIKTGTREQELITHRNCTDISSSASSIYSSNMKLEIEQDVSSTQTCHNCTVEYCHAGQQFSLRTILTRSFSSSRFARLGVGIRHTFGNVFNNSEWWKQGTTSWLFKLERGDVRLLIPVTIYPVSTTAFDSLVRILYVSMTSIVVDIIVSELLCGVTSKLRLRFLKILLGKDKVDEVKSSSKSKIEKEQEEKENCLLQEQLFKVKEHIARQVNLMAKQAKAATKREEDQGGLVIVKAIYGVIDNKSRQWIQYRETKTGKMISHTMNVTTQLQFWVTNSSLHLPAVSKKHMLGFYDLLAFVSDDEWEIQPTTNQKDNTRSSLFGWWKEKLMGTQQKRIDLDLVVVLSIQYKFDNKLYQVVFHDDEAVDLPSQYAEEVVVE